MLDAEIKKIERIIGYKFRNKALLETAFTHESYVNEMRDKTESYDRLEFLGDAVLDVIVSEELYAKLKENSGKMTATRAKIVSKEPLAAAIDKMQLMQFMRIGVGSFNNVRESIKARSDLFEAIVAAIYLDSMRDFDAVRNFVIARLDTGLNTVDYKSMFQEHCQKHFPGNPIPVYSREQDTDSGLFISRVTVDGKVYGAGSGKNRQSAEKLAAKEALEKLGILS